MKSWVISLLKIQKKTINCGDVTNHVTILEKISSVTKYKNVLECYGFSIKKTKK